MTKTLRELAHLTGAEIRNTPDADRIQITGVKPIGADAADFLTFVNAKSYVSQAKSSRAAAFLCNEEVAAELDRPVLVVKQVEVALARILNEFHPPAAPNGTISPHAVIDPTAQIGKNTSIGHFVTIGPRSRIGDNCIVADGVKIAEDVQIGDNARIGMNCVFMHGVRIGNNFTVFANSSFGGDGFGFVFANGGHQKIPQVGGVVIGNDVEVGSNCTVDRGALNDTVIGDGCKLDNMVHVAHNCIVGKHVIIAGQSGLAGSVVLGDNVLVGGACAISDHVTILPETIVAGGTALRNSPKEKGVYVGWDWGFTFPEFQRMRSNMRKLVDFNKFAKRLKDAEKKLGIEAEE
jgi:UDP-3-O-[3-hydroxymyristoyl] glucosamine N-acyltransferase